MIPGSAAAALPASLAKTRPRAWSVFLAHSRRPPLSDGADGGDGGVTVPPPPVNARTSVLIAMPTAVRMLTKVTPCSRKRVLTRFAKVVSSFNTLPIVSRMREIWERRASFEADAASSRADLSSCRSRRRSAMRRLINSSTPPASASSSLRFSKAMWSSSSVSLARLLVSSPRMVCRALSSPRISRRVSGGSSSVPRTSSIWVSVSAVSILWIASETSVTVCPRSSSSTLSTAAAASPSSKFVVWRASTAWAGKLDFLAAQSAKPRSSRIAFVPPRLAKVERA